MLGSNCFFFGLKMLHVGFKMVRFSVRMLFRLNLKTFHFSFKMFRFSIQMFLYFIFLSFSCVFRVFPFPSFPFPFFFFFLFLSILVFVLLLFFHLPFLFCSALLGFPCQNRGTKPSRRDKAQRRGTEKKSAYSRRRSPPRA